MPNVIYKYALTIATETDIVMPKGARLLSVQVQRGEPMVWAIVDHSQRTVRRRLSVRETGNPLEDAFSGAFIGTIQMYGGAIVFHVFDCGEV